MKKSSALIAIVLVCVSCKVKQIETEEQTMDQFYQSLIEIKNKKTAVPQERINMVTVPSIEDYFIDFSCEDYYQLEPNGIARHNSSMLDIDEDIATYKINEYGFLTLTTDNRTYTIFDHDIHSATDINYENARYALNENNVSSIISDGFFSETLQSGLVEYKIENILKAVILPTDRCGNPEYTNSIPFVTKRGNSGIGEKIYIKCKQPYDYISIMPGYVNTTRPDLFYKNNRPKDIRIRDTDTKYCVETTLSDIAMFQDIRLYEKMRNIEIEILDVYPGTKYDDTCISGILLKNQ